MTETDWLNSLDLVELLRSRLGKAGDRKFRLFACGCLRRIWRYLVDDRSRAAVETAERYADRQAIFADLRQARAAAQEAVNTLAGSQGGPSRSRSEESHARWQAVQAAAAVVQDTGWDVACQTAELAMRALGVHAMEEHEAQCRLLRDVFGNPYHPVRLEKAWLNWNSGLAPHMAKMLYEQSSFEELPILADALEDAGCDNYLVLDHLRSGEEHTRGCWVLDTLLGKK
jgi:hypothetical protein